jgi:NADH-quinone oxidoreductase subunit E
MAKSADTRQGGRAADQSADFGRLAAEMLQNAPVMPLHPLMAHPAAAFATATAIGFGLSTQMAGAFWGALQGAVEATNRLAAALEEQAESAPQARTAPAKADGAGEAKPAEAASPVKAEVAAERAAGKAAPLRAKPNASAVREKAAPKQAKPVQRARRPSARADDLKRISGIGPKLETVLNGRGIRTFADIASWSDDDVKRIDAELGFEGRIARDDWVGQARSLAPKAPGRK